MHIDSQTRARAAQWRTLWLLLTVILVPIGTIAGFLLGSLLLVIISLACGVMGFVILESVL